MQQNINYQGMQTQPSDHDTPDGSMHLALNVEKRSGSYHAARIPTTEEFYIENFTPLFIHNPSSDNTTDNIVIGVYYKDTDGADWDYELKAYYYTKQSDKYTEITINNNNFGTNDGPSDFDNFCNIGNIVCFTLKGKVSYLSYIKSSYNAIFGNPPSIKANYYILRRYPSRVNISDTPIGPDPKDYFNYNMTVVENVKGLKCTANIEKEYATDISILNKIKNSNELKERENNIFGALNSTRARFEEQGYLMFPVLVVCAYRLYDGSTIMATDPVLTYPIDARTQLFYAKYANRNNYDKENDENLQLAIFSEAYRIFVQLDSGIPNSSWREIIASIDFFISSPLYNIESDKLYYSFGNNNSVSGTIFIDLMDRDDKEIIENVDAFYLVKSVPFEKMSKLKNKIVFENAIGTITEEQCILPNDITNYTQSEKLKINSYNRFDIYAKKTQNRNNRLIISNIKKLFDINSFSNIPQITYLNITKNPQKKDGLTTYTVSKQSPSMQDIKSKEELSAFKLNDIKIAGVYVKDIGDVSFTNVIQSNNFFLSFYDNKITKIIVEIEKSYSYQNLSQNTIAGFSFYIRNNTYEGYFTEVKNNDYEEYLPSLIKASETNNPFVFKDGNSAECGIGEIITIASNARAVSQGQFGQYPIFAFCTDGIYAVGLGTDGTLQSCNPYTYDIITSPLSVCNIQTSLAYITRSGIHIIGNDGPQEILSYNQEDNYNFDNERQQTFIGKHYNNLPTLVSPYTYFTQGAHLTYDYPNQRIIAYNPQHTYSYIYSIPNQTWSIILQSYDGHINTFSQSLLIKDNKIYNLSSQTIQNKLNGLLITRPIKLDSPDVHKTIQTIIQRGNFPSGSIAQALYASNDAINWFPIWSSQTERLRPIRGTAYKYYRLVIFLTDFKQDYSLSGCTIDYLPKLTNKIR